MTKDEITYLFENVFSINEIKAMEKPSENPAEGGKASGEAEVTDKAVDNPETPIVEEVEADKKKEEVGLDFSELRKEIEDLKKTFQKEARKNVDLPDPKEKSVEEEMESFFMNL